MKTWLSYSISHYFSLDNLTLLRSHVDLCQKNEEYLRVILVLDKVKLLLDSFASLCDPQLEGTPTAALSENEIIYNSKYLLILYQLIMIS